MASEPSVFALEDRGRLVEPEKFAAFLSDAEGQPVQIDACDLPIITSMHLQIHIAAKAQWDAQGLPYEVINKSEQFEHCLSLLGWQEPS